MVYNVNMIERMFAGVTANMWQEEYLRSIVDQTVVHVTDKVAGILLRPSPDSRCLPDQGWAAISIAITGMEDGPFTLYYRAEPHVFRAIAEKMKRRPVDDEQDMAVYLKEYFNILCGHIISRINRETKSSMRFGIPTYHEEGKPISGEHALRICYECAEQNGSASITGVAQKIDF